MVRRPVALAAVSTVSPVGHLSRRQTKTVTFRLTPNGVGFYNSMASSSSSRGQIDVYVGDSSTAIVTNSFTVQEGGRAGSDARTGRRSEFMRHAIIAGLLGLGVATALVAAPGAEAASGVAPSAPGARALWTAGNKDGFGTATTSASKVWYTLGGGELTEVYYPNLGTPAIRDLQFVITDGKSWIERERENNDHTLTLTDPRSLSYQQINTDPNRRYRITKTYTTDPARSVLLMRVRFESLTNQPLRLYVLYDPSLSGNGDDDSGSTAGTALMASDATAASALVASPAFTKTSSGYLGTSDGWSDLRADYTMDWNYGSAPDGNVAQTAAWS
jgi:glucoamylase